MTVALAMRFDGGYLLASDSASSETTWHYTMPGPKKKLRSIGACVLAIAGNSDFAWRMVDAVKDKRTHSAKDLSSSLSKLCRRSHADEDGDVQFIVVDASDAFLLYAGNHFKVTPRHGDGFLSIGRSQVAGYYLTRYWHEGMSLKEAERLAGISVLESGAVIDGVDGRLQMAVVTQEGPTIYADVYPVREVIDPFLQSLEAEFRRMLV